jgi:hypothetical protein
VSSSACTKCAQADSQIRLYRWATAKASFLCEGCRKCFCAERVATLDGLRYCLACATAAVESQEPECECRQTDVDQFDARGCEFHDPSSTWNVRMRVLIAIQEFEEYKGECMGWLNGKAAVTIVTQEAGASVAALAPAAEPGKALVVPDIKQSIINPFAKAVKYAAKGRVALIGPAGSGKSYTMLLLARALAGPNGRIAAIDTEHGSLSKYADLFDFDVMELDSFSPDAFVGALHAAEAAAYDVFCCDSLSHFWVGRDGALEFVDMASKRNRDNMGGWKEFRPHERLMVDEMISSTCHVICTMRTKTDYQEQTDSNGKKKRVKVGLAPVQRDGLEYEFDLVGYMDEDNTFITDKTRCSAYAQKAFTKPGPKEFAPLAEWLEGAAGAPRAKRPAPQIDIGNNQPNSVAAAQYVAQQKIAAATTAAPLKAPWKNMIEVDQFLQSVRERVGEVAWRGALDACGWRELMDIRNAMDSRDSAARDAARQKARELYWRLDTLARKEGK